MYTWSRVAPAPVESVAMHYRILVLLCIPAFTPRGVCDDTFSPQSTIILFICRDPLKANRTRRRRIWSVISTIGRSMACFSWFWHRQMICCSLFYGYMFGGVFFQTPFQIKSSRISETTETSHFVTRQTKYQHVASLGHRFLSTFQVSISVLFFNSV